MSTTRPWPQAAPLATARLYLEPLRVSHAGEAAAVFDDVRLHRWTGGRPRTREELEATYRRRSVGCSPDGRRGWLNWMLRRRSDQRLLGTVQATLSRTGPSATVAELAWVIATDHQRHGYAREAATGVVAWLRARGIVELRAHIHPCHDASQAVARALGLRPTDVVADGEVLWRAVVG
ncbi:GNAT family N-acetyltransferase [Saccharopolyspora flava]|uniref:Protein N-acetyltransferase, RimJ/RimL family n=1 Tax=Saccharopolyspora flava TaxID=95161 RepID=A0A1I6SW15_9PSEU|nr:GNAT family N-acetyltransferase [Saccharopolyspora flava]SFS81063.1 Protein N-acetyltransferase, RimJ/RimL family [Saccharopolyspora flava]